MRTWLVIGAGGAIGSIVRHELNTFLTNHAIARKFPAGIFIINVIGSALIGLLSGAIAGGRLSISEQMRFFLAAGILGGFTTFSAFSLDTFALFRSKQYGFALANAVGQVGISFLAVWVGFRIAAGSNPET